MTEIKMPRDDAAIRINAKASPDRAVHPVEASPDVHPVRPHEEPTQVTPPSATRPKRRRQGERRKKNMRVLLDTRCGADRRGGDLTDDQAAEEEDQNRDAGPGIDVYV